MHSGIDPAANTWAGVKEKGTTGSYDDVLLVAVS